MTQHDAIQDGKKHIVASMTAIFLAFLFIVMILLAATALHILLILAIIPIAIVPIFFFRIYHIIDWKIQVYSQLNGREGFLEKAERQWILMHWIDNMLLLPRSKKRYFANLNQFSRYLNP